MTDEVAVTELIEREGWAEAPSSTRSRFRVVAVMVAVVLGCGLAALLVHIGSEEQRADKPNPAIFDMPHGPSGGLAGGGVPASPQETEVTGTSTSITVTNVPPPEGSNGLPWAHHQPQRTSTVTVTESRTGHSTTPTTTSPPPPGGGTGGHGGGAGSQPQNPPSSTDNPPPTRCVLNITLVCIPLG